MLVAGGLALLLVGRAASAEPDRSVWFSQQLQTDETPRWHEGLKVQLTDSDERIVALASLDQTLVIFTRSRIFAVSGLGPADTGRDGAFSGPAPIATAFGCLDPGSVVSTSRGVNCAFSATKLTTAGIGCPGKASSTMRASLPSATCPALSVGR